MEVGDGSQDVHGLLHGAGGLDNLWEEHLALAETTPHLVHACHQRPLNDVHGSRIALQSLAKVGLKGVADASDECLLQAFLYDYRRGCAVCRCRRG